MTDPQSHDIDIDTVIVGAGAAGLAAAKDLSEAGKSIVIIEARGRVGGRVFTYRDPSVNVPIELGAEFLHGKTPETSAIIDAARLTAVDVTGGHWLAQDGKFASADDFWTDVNKVLRKLESHRSPDRSFADFLASRARRKKDKPKRQRARALALEFVQGFHAADPSRVSERWLAHGGDPRESPEESRMGRVVEGYDRVTAWLADNVYETIELNTVVERIEWQRGSVRLTARTAERASRTVTARTAIVTASVGVLQAQAPQPGAITFAPEVVPIRDAIQQLAMGPVLRCVFAFSERFWERGVRRAPNKGDLSSLSFLHSPGSPVPVWWTLYPVRAPVLVGWVGGPPATELYALPDGEIERRALRDLAQHLGTTHDRLAGLLVGNWMHNWERDPFARGAYSYALVGGSGAARKLARPIEQTLFFAGEATDTEGRSGTVEGAIATGRRAARGVLQALA